MSIVRLVIGVVYSIVVFLENVINICNSDINCV